MLLLYKGIFRNYGIQLAREDQWDFGGLKTRSETELEASSQFTNKWRAEASLSYQAVVDTRMLRGGPALRWHAFYETQAFLGSDESRRASVHAHGGYSWARDDDSRAWNTGAGLDLRPSNRLKLFGSVSYENLLDNLQYAATADREGGQPRWVLGRIDQDTWSFTFRVNLSITPDLTLQYYGSPFIGTGRYTEFKRATAERLAEHLVALQADAPIDVVVTSDLQRARATAEALTRRGALELALDAAWREQSFGMLEGLEVALVQQQHPELWAQWLRHDPDWAVPGGESNAAFYARVQRALDSLVASFAGLRVAVVTHGGVLDMLWRRVHGRPPVGPRECEIPNTGINRLRWTAEGLQILRRADGAHPEGLPLQATTPLRWTPVE